MSDASEDTKTVLLRFRVSRRLHEYLTFLARHSILGASEADVAEHVLTRRLEEMLHSDYHAKRVPHDDPDD